MFCATLLKWHRKHYGTKTPKTLGKSGTKTPLEKWHKPNDLNHPFRVFVPPENEKESVDCSHEYEIP